MMEQEYFTEEEQAEIRKNLAEGMARSNEIIKKLGIKPHPRIVEMKKGK